MSSGGGDSMEGSVVSVIFQSSAMGDIFTRFPRALLVHRTGGMAGRALYVFLVAGPAPTLPCAMARVVHLTVLQDESLEILAHMYAVFRAFNPAWPKTQLLLVSPDFPHPLVLAQAFPAAKMQHSIFYLCKLLQQQIQQLALEARARHLIMSTLRSAMDTTTPSSRRKAHAILRELVSPDLLPQLHMDWLLHDEIWATQKKRTWGENSSYFRDLEVVIQGLNQVFSVECSLNSCINSLAQHHQKCVSESLPGAVKLSTSQPDHQAAQAAPPSLPASGLNLNPLACEDKPSQSSLQASFTTAEAQQKQLVAASSTAAESLVIALQSPVAAPEVPRILQQQPETPQAVLQSEPASLQSSLDPSSPTVKLEPTENPEGNSEEEINQRTEERIKQALRDICTEPAARLCLSEFAVVQKSMQLINTEQDALSIQVLEDAHTVDLKGLRGCTCYFSQVFQLPCRHILAVLNSYKKTLHPEMLGKQWQKGSNPSEAGQDSASGLLEVLKSSWDESLDKSLLVSFLTAEISRLLTCCSGEEFEHRYRTLRELADSWIGPYIEVKL